MNWITKQEEPVAVGVSVGAQETKEQTIIASPPRKTPTLRAKKEISNDPVNHPAHYKIGGIETIDFIEAKELNYNLGNVVKYVTRAHYKGNLIEDLKKGAFYLAREIANLEKKL
jgi:hypothetical protein